ncbi:MAG: class I SAM-dependent methyltransferase [Pseudomonadota bacterium]
MTATPHPRAPAARADKEQSLAARYDAAAPKWHDKMRALGYYDGYLGFLSEPGHAPVPQARVLDIGAGTGAMAEAWVAVHGAPAEMTLLDPSAAMLDSAVGALRRHGVEARAVAAGLEQADGLPLADEVLAAHLIEHFDDASAALALLRARLKPDGRLRLVVSKPHWCNAIVWLRWRHRCYTPPAVRALLRDAGFALEMEYAFPSGPPSRTSRGYVARPV